MAVWILEVACVAAIERRLRRLDELCARLLCLSHDQVDLFPGGDVVADGELNCACGLHGQAAVRAEALARPQGKLQALLKIEESDCPVLELRSDDAPCAEAQAMLYY